MIRKHNTEKGFTLIELMLAMAFVSVLLLFIALTVLQIANIYNKGLTIKNVNQAGLTITSDIRQTISGGQPFDPTVTTGLCLQSSNGGCPTTNLQDVVGGRLCTGTYSYIWNYGKALANPVNKYDSGTDKILFARVRDSGGQYCADSTKKIDESDATELLSGVDGDLAIQSFDIQRVVNDPTVGQALYHIVMEISTNNQDALQQSPTINTIDTTCRPPSDSASLINYCAVNQFDFTAEAGGGSQL